MKQLLFFFAIVFSLGAFGQATQVTPVQLKPGGDGQIIKTSGTSVIWGDLPVGSGNYIQNQFISKQVANAWLDSLKGVKLVGDTVRASNFRVSQIRGYDYDGATNTGNAINMSRNGGNYIEFWTSGGWDDQANSTGKWQFFKPSNNSSSAYQIYEGTSAATDLYYSSWGTPTNFKMHFGAYHDKKLTIENSRILLNKPFQSGDTSAANASGYQAYISGATKLAGNIVQTTGTLTTSNIVQVGLDTASYKIVVVDGSGNHYKSYWPVSGAGGGNRFGIEDNIFNEDRIINAKNYLIEVDSLSELYLNGYNPSTGQSSYFQIIGGNSQTLVGSEKSGYTTYISTAVGSKPNVSIDATSVPNDNRITIVTYPDSVTIYSKVNSTGAYNNLKFYLHTLPNATTSNILYYDPITNQITQGAAPSGSGGLIDGDYGDITVGGTGTTMTIDNLAVTDAKVNDVAWGKITGTPTTLAGYGISNALTSATGSTQSGYFGDIFFADGNGGLLQVFSESTTPFSLDHILTLDVNNGDRRLKLSGDLTVSATATVSGTNTGDQFTNTTAARLLGRYTATNGTAQEISIGTGLALNSTTGVLSNTITNNNQLTNGAGYLTSSSTAFIQNQNTSGQAANFYITGTGRIETDASNYFVLNAGADNAINQVTNTASFKRWTMQNTSAAGAAASGFLFLNDLGDEMQFYHGSSGNTGGYGARTSAIRTTGTGGFKLIANNGDLQFQTASTERMRIASTGNITFSGTITAGTWNGGVIAGQYGGTGVNNSGKTITLGGNLTTSGAFATTLTVTAATNVTLPTTGTLATQAGSETLTNKTINGSSNTITNVAQTKGVSFVSPSASEQQMIWKVGSGGATISSVDIAVRGSSPSVTYTLNYGTTYGTAVGTIVASNTVTTTGSATLNTTAIPANSYIWLSTSASTGVIDEFTVSINYKQ